ncbi:uncharacterized protein LOC116127367 isoform X2 [Pistacia vera]|uniref:uncharacterized protein LOC116127367 isoform X1 n=1 Tax=Pistacia vera TaxID=55513 RepID=UPI0012631D1B|nr:uncharacterized protein LOC116127367 isoform X1 [Pistacia vera]XP_031268872.1 uncharacterized protein LOC116127367 isoform X2 [Pistacia vera]
MGWNYADISLEEMMKLIKGFVDVLILASGYQSSGLPAHWDAHNIKKAFHWALFFENVFRQLSSTDVYLDSLKELDAALNEMTSNPSFPQGLLHLSCATLSRARAFVSEHFIHPLPLRDAHLSAYLRATVEMDLNELSKIEDDCLNMYLQKLMLLDSSLNLVQEPKGFVKDSFKSSSDVAPPKKIEKCTTDDFTAFAVQGLSKRQSALSCISTIKTGLDVLSTAVKHSSWTEPDNSFSEEHLKQERAPALMGGEDDLVDFVTWNCWKSRNFLYFLDMRTVRLVSGASMIFSAPKCQWVQIFERLHLSAEGSDDDLSEMIELLLLGCIGSKWSCLIEHFMSISYDSLTISKQYYELCQGIQHFHSKEEMMNLKETCILEYLIELLSGRLHQLWKLPPALISVAIPSWSPLFRLYLSEIETHFKGDTLTMRFCSCSQDGKEHKNCELAERIWLLYIFHIYGSHLMSGAISA